MADTAPAPETHEPIWFRPLLTGDEPAGYRQCVVCGDHDYNACPQHDGDGTEMVNPTPEATVPVAVDE